MAAGQWTLTNATRLNIWNRYTGGGSALTFKVALVASSSNIGLSSTTWAGVTNEVAAGNGYSAGGVSVTLSASGTTSVPVVFSSNPVWTASGGSIVARTAVLYEVGGNVVAYCLLDNTPADVTVTAGNTLTIDSDGTPSPVITIA